MTVPSVPTPMPRSSPDRKQQAAYAKAYLLSDKGIDSSRITIYTALKIERRSRPLEFRRVQRSMSPAIPQLNSVQSGDSASGSQRHSGGPFLHTDSSKEDYKSVPITPLRPEIGRRRASLANLLYQRTQNSLAPPQTQARRRNRRPTPSGAGTRGRR